MNPKLLQILLVVIVVLFVIGVASTWSRGDEEMSVNAFDPPPRWLSALSFLGNAGPTMAGEELRDQQSRPFPEVLRLTSEGREAKYTVAAGEEGSTRRARFGVSAPRVTITYTPDPQQELEGEDRVQTWPDEERGAEDEASFFIYDRGGEMVFTQRGDQPVEIRLLGRGDD